ncbi:phosphoglucosamine mutase [Candidatus Margulisiibacteriota bacterium]
MKSLIESLSGTRGIIGENLHPKIGLNMATAFGTLVGKGPVIVGGDTRVSYEMLKNTVISGLISVGTDVIDIGKVPTPTVQQMIIHHKAAGGMVITASHNPVMWNGIKLMNKTGSFLDDTEYEKYLKIYHADAIKLADWPDLGSISRDDKALEKHIDKIISILDIAPIKNSGLKVLIDPNNGAGCIPNEMLLKKLNIDYTIINKEPHGRFTHNPEPVKANLNQIMAELSSGKYDIGFVQDADADRLVILDEKGTFIGEDYSLAFCMDYILSKDQSTNKKIVVNLSTSMIADWLAKKYNAEIFYTIIGESNVTQEIKRQNALVGGEGNGGVIYPKVGWGRDSLVGIVIALKHLAEKKQSVSEIIATYPKYILLRDKIQISAREDADKYLAAIEDKHKNCKINKEDGIKIIFEESWAHIRPSNTEPIMRMFVEAGDEVKAKLLLSEIKHIIASV